MLKAHKTQHEGQLPFYTFTRRKKITLVDNSEGEVEEPVDERKYTQFDIDQEKLRITHQRGELDIQEKLADEMIDAINLIEEEG